MPNFSIRGVLAVGIVAGGLVLLGLHTITFDQTLALTGPVTALYFGQYVSPPNQEPVALARPKARGQGGQSLVQVLVAVALVLVIVLLLRMLGAV